VRGLAAAITEFALVALGTERDQLIVPVEPEQREFSSNPSKTNASAPSPASGRTSVKRFE
jgi:hypothetical protein